jgi:hypothetical protein
MRWPVPIAVVVMLLALASAHAPARAEAATRYVAPTGADGGGCTQQAPCRSWAAAYQSAGAGDDVELAGGEYGDVALRGLARKASSARVVFRPAPGARVTVGDLDIDGTHDVEIQGVSSSEGWQVHGMAENVVLRDVRVVGSRYGGFLGGSRGVRVIGGEIGSIDPNDGLHMNVADGQNYDTVIDGLYMHDLTRTQDPSAHTDCVQAGSAIGLVIRNSRFVNCATQGIFLSQYGGGTTSDITLENNWLGPAQLGFYALYVGLATNVTVRNNSIAGSGAFVDTPASATTMVGNILASTDAFGCATLAQRAARFAYNVTPAGCPGAAAAVTDSEVESSFVNASAADSGAFDLHLRPGAKAIGRGDPGSFPATDIDGQSRPQSGAPDAGADEYGTAPSGPTEGSATPPAAAESPVNRVRELVGPKFVRIAAVDRLPGVRVYASERPLSLRATARSQRLLAVVADRAGTLKVRQRVIVKRRSVRLRTRTLRLRAGEAQAVVVRLTRPARKRLRTTRTARLALAFAFGRAVDSVTLRTRRP